MCLTDLNSDWNAGWPRGKTENLHKVFIWRSQASSSNFALKLTKYNCKHPTELWAFLLKLWLQSVAKVQLFFWEYSFNLCITVFNEISLCLRFVQSLSVVDLQPCRVKDELCWQKAAEDGRSHQDNLCNTSCIFKWRRCGGIQWWRERWAWKDYLKRCYWAENNAKCFIFSAVLNVSCSMCDYISASDWIFKKMHH